MRIYVKVTPRAGKNEVLKISEEEYKVKVTAPPEKGKANERVIELLAYYFKVPKSSIKIIAGKTVRIKIIDVGRKDIPVSKRQDKNSEEKEE